MHADISINGCKHCHVIDGNEKKRVFHKRVLQIDHDTFTSMVFTIYGSMARECHTFYSKLSDLLSEKRNLLSQ